MDLSLEIDVIQASELNPEYFKLNYFDPQKPLLIKGLGKLPPAGKNWTIDYFRKAAGEDLIELFDSTNPEHKRTTSIKYDLKMKFTDFLDIIEKDVTTPYRMFVYNLFKQQPALRKDFPCPDIFKGFLDKMGYFFMGGKNTQVRIHYDVDYNNVLLTQFYGRKQVVLIEPKYTKLLYRLPLTTQTDVDITNPDYKSYPGLKYVKGYKFVQESGDALFMPSCWWHYMTYLEGGIAVSYRKLNKNPFRNLKGIASLTLLVPFDKLMSKLFKLKWFEYKKKIAIRRANREIHSLESQN